MGKERFYVNKTRFEMFDVCRAYGLAFLITGFGEEATATIIDKEYTYYIDVVEGSILGKPDAELFADVDEWRSVFGRSGGRKDAKEKPPKLYCEEVLNNEYSNILDIHRRMDYVPEFENKKQEGKRTLYQIFDVSASKGFREQKKGLVYHEGSQLFVDQYSWVLACIGRVFFGFRIIRGEKKRGYILTVIPNPAEVLLPEHRQIQKDLDQKQLCGISPNATLVHYAIKLTLLLKRRKPKTRYDVIIFNALQKTGQSPKPGGGGKYSLNFLESLAETPQGFLALKEIDKKFPLSRRVKGIQQDLALALTDFLLRPTLENFRTFESLYIRGQINKKFYPWHKQQLEEIMKYVEAV